MNLKFRNSPDNTRRKAPRACNGTLCQITNAVMFIGGISRVATFDCSSEIMTGTVEKCRRAWTELPAFVVEATSAE
jgi:hypothetical protein